MKASAVSMEEGTRRNFVGVVGETADARLGRTSCGEGEGEDREAIVADEEVETLRP